jgi:hypothetical protein
LKTQKEGRRPAIFDTLWHFILIDFHAKKYQDGCIFLGLKSLAYFDDADEQEILFMFQNTSWEQLKILLKRIR